MKHFSRVLAVGALCALVGTSTSFAQQGGGGNGGGGRQGGRQGRPTPEQMEQMMAQFRERQIRTSLTDAGYTDPTTQDAVIAFANQQAAVATGMLPKIDALRNAFRDKADDKTVTDALVGYRTAVAEARKNRETAIADLDKSVSFSTKPKMEALLVMLGLIGDENSFVSNQAGQATLPGAMGGMRGMMGGMRGMGGGGNGGGGNGGGRRNGGGNGGGGNNDAPPPPPGGDI